MDRRRLHELAERWIRLWEPGNLDAFDELHATDFIDRSSAGRDPTREGFRQGILELLESFPDLQIKVEDVVIDEHPQRLAIRWSASGTHRGRYLGADPTGRRIAFQGIEIVQVRDGRVVERWGEWDGLDLIRQLKGNA
jgi:steroid delta-isomerase-like uncharacterized protein